MDAIEPTAHQTVAALVLFAMASAWTLRMILRRKLDAQHAFVLFAVGAFILVFVMWAPFRHTVMGALGIGMPASAIFLLALLLQGIVSIYFASRLAQLAAQIKRLSQEIALLESLTRPQNPLHPPGNVPPANL
jgi:hypothetical protein